MSKTNPNLKTKEIQKGMFGCYYLELGLPNHIVRDPDVSERYKKLLEEEANGELEKKFPRCPYGEARAHLGLTKADLDDMIIAKADPEGNLITEDPDVARIALHWAKQLNPHARLHPTSLPIPEKIERSESKKDVAQGGGKR